MSFDSEVIGEECEYECADDREMMPVQDEVCVRKCIYMSTLVSTLILCIFQQEIKERKIMSILDAYIFQLRTNNAIALCSGSLNDFVLQDFSEETLCLKVSFQKTFLHLTHLLSFPLHYNFVSRSAKQFEDSIEWVYHCTCDSHTSKLSTSLSSILECNYSEFLEKFPECLHIQAVMHASSKLDAIHCLSPVQYFLGTYETLVH